MKKTMDEKPQTISVVVDGRTVNAEVEKVLDWAAKRKPGEHYKARACVVACFDDGFTCDCGMLEAFLRSQGLSDPARPVCDVIKVPGGAKALASPAYGFERDALLAHVLASVKLHSPERVILTLHSDCGGYGGLAAWGGDLLQETKNHVADLIRGAEFLKSRLPAAIPIETYLFSFDGVRRIH